MAAEAKRGDQDSFRKLVEGLSRTLMAMAYRYTRDWEWARDLTQESWIRVHENLHRYDANRSFSAWLFSLHRNVCRDHLRRPFVTREKNEADGMIQELGGSASDSPEEDLERREFRERILDAANGLSESQREVFLRVDVEQGEQKEVAQTLGIRFGTLRTTLHFARKKVAKALREMDGRMEAGT